MRTLHAELVVAADRCDGGPSLETPHLEDAAKVLSDLQHFTDRVKTICLDLAPYELYRMRCELALFDRCLSGIEQGIQQRREHDAKNKQRELEAIGRQLRKNTTGRLGRSVALLLPPGRRPAAAAAPANTAPPPPESSSEDVAPSGETSTSAPSTRSNRRRRIVKQE